MTDLIRQLENVERLASSSKLYRLASHPFNYIFALTFNKILYPLFKKGITRTVKTFFNRKIYVVLPSGTDIYITRGKSHNSEIRLAKFLINYLKDADTFIDVGAHIGYFSLLASELVGQMGKVVSFEASLNTFKVLSMNIKGTSNIEILNNAISNTNEILSFYEFPVLYSEYNSLHIEQFENESWIVKYKPEKVDIESITLDSYISSESLTPRIIKIDVEGAEFKVLQGLTNFLGANVNCYVVMEYLNPSRNNKEHQDAKQYIEKMGYQSYLIDTTGHLVPISDVDTYLSESGAESDNIVFSK